MASPTIYFDLGNTLIFGPPDNRQPFPDAVATIVELYNRGYLLGLLSDQADGTTVAQVRTRLQGYGFDPYIEPITISSELPGNVFKPDPAIFALALQKGGHPAASADTIFVTETFTHIQAARALGWRAILKTNGGICGGGVGECVPDLDTLLDIFLPLDIDLYFRDAVGDPGEDLFAGPRFWDSPDLWIRNDADGGIAHQEPEVGQDNWFNARVHNRGVGIARAFQASFEVKAWAGTQFVFPQDYVPAIAYASGANLRPGDSQVLTARWPAAEVPTEGTHACWISAVFTSGDSAPAGRRVWEHNNLAQKNLTTVDLIPGDSAVLPLRIGSRVSRTEQELLVELHRPPKWANVPVELVHRDPVAVRELWSSFTPAVRSAGPIAVEPLVEVLTPTRVRLAASPQPLRFDLAAHSAIGLAGAVEAPAGPVWAGRPATAAFATGRGTAGIRFDPGATSSFGVRLGPARAQEVGLRVTVPASARPGEAFVIDLVERDAQDNVVGGVALRVRVREP